VIPAKHPNQRWSMDCMRDTLGCGRPFRTPNVLDEFTREALAIEVARSIPREAGTGAELVTTCADR